VSELDPSTLGSFDATRARDAELAALIGDRSEREGLPRNYRMRADAHYVDQLDRAQAGPVVRLVSPRHIDAGELPSAASLTPLSQSIAAHGMLQPLLVRRAGSRYQLIAGRRRLAAALSAGLNDVPCIIHELNDEGAQAMADAERASAVPAEPAAKPDDLAALFRALSQDLARIGSLTDVLELANNRFQHQTAADFLKAETWRTAWLVNAAALVTSAAASGRTLAVSRALDRVRNGFEPEVRLAKVQLELSAAPECGDLQCDDRFGTIVTGLIFATLSWVQGCDWPRIEGRVDSPAPHALRMQIIQRLAPAPAHSSTPGQAGTLIEAFAVASARAFAASQGGSLEIGPVGHRGALIQLVFNRPQHG
jgi:hypothetical protein